MSRKKNRNGRPHFFMSVDSITEKFKLSAQWNHTCIVCGEPFTNLACITIEHTQPLVRDGADNTTNTAPSHHRCNTIKSDDSLILASTIMKLIKEVMPQKKFVKWINAPVPNRQTPAFALMTSPELVAKASELEGVSAKTWLRGRFASVSAFQRRCGSLTDDRVFIVR